MPRYSVQLLSDELQQHATVMIHNMHVFQDNVSFTESLESNWVLLPSLTESISSIVPFGVILQMRFP